MAVFKAGKHTDMLGRTKDYSPDYVAKLAATAETLRTAKGFHLEPPAVIGHEFVQAKLAEILSGDDVYKTFMAGDKPTSGGGPSRTDQLAAGWPENFRFDSATGTMLADFERIPPSVADLIDTDQLRYTSAEIKHDLEMPDGSKVDTIHRVAWLGGNPPACKTIPPLGQSHFADSGVIYFADAGGTATDMTPLAEPDKPVLALLKKIFAFLTPKFLSSLTRPQVDQLAADAAAAMDGQPDQSAAYGVTAMADANSTVKPPVSDADRKAMVEAIKADLKASLTADLTAAFADREKTLAEKEKAMDEKAAAFHAEADGAIKTLADRQSEESRKAIDAFCDAECGVRIRPAELDESDPKTAYLSLRQEMYRADAKSQVTCFADNGTEVKKTPLQIMMDRVKARPLLPSGDRVRGAGNENTQTAAFYEGIRKEARESYAAASAAPAIPVSQRLGMLAPRHLR